MGPWRGRGPTPQKGRVRERARVVVSMGYVLTEGAGGSAKRDRAHRDRRLFARGAWRLVVVVVSIALTVVLSVGAASALAAEASCANVEEPLRKHEEQLRLEDHSTQLPDCRAYELVSPPFKDGYEPFFKAVSPDGDHALWESLGTFDGAKGNNVVEGTIYESSRTPSGWQAKAVSPPASTFAFAQWQDASLDLSHTLWTAHTTSQSADAEDLYVREPDGSFVLVGPQLPPSDDKAPPAAYESRYGHSMRYVGATPNLSHIFFEIQPGEGAEEDILWPGDTTLAGSNARSLYEYNGVGNQEPKLVGVRNEGHLSSNTEAEMITQCGVELGGGITLSTYNAVSDSGRTVYFTAKEQECENGEGIVGTGPTANEIYARVDEAKSIDISEPTSEDCETCDTSSRERAFFQGASQDGTKAFFLSGQEGLLPGAEGMNLYEYNFNGPEHNKLVRVSGGVAEPQVQGVVRVSNDGSRIYFVAKSILASNENAQGGEAIEGENNLYIFNSITGATSFIATLTATDKEDWRRQDARPVQATTDGRFLIFPSFAHLTPDNVSGPTVLQLFEYDAETGILARVSKGQRGNYFCSASGKIEGGYNCNGNTLNPLYEANSSAWVLSFTRDRGISGDDYRLTADGTKVIFETFNPLAPGAVNSLSGKLCSNVYEYHWSENEGGMTEGDVSLVSDGQDVTMSNKSCGSAAYSVDLAGLDVFVTSTDRLVSQDGDTQRDVYVARELGGFPAVVSSSGCVADGCQGSLSVAPQLFGASSVTQAGGGNLTPPPVSKPVVGKKARALTRAQKLAKALAVCRKEPRRKRGVCVSRARKRFGLARKATVSRKRRK